MSALTIPELSLVVLVGPSGSGKSTFAAKHFLASEILSSDRCRAFVSNDENDMAATSDAFDVLYAIARKRLARGLLTVIDATNVQKESRVPILALAKEFHVLPVAVVLALPSDLCHERNAARTDRRIAAHVLRGQAQRLRQSLRGLPREGFRHVHILRTPEEVDAATLVRTPLWNNRRNEHGPFDIIGDVHGCFDELVALLAKLGYSVAHAEGADGPCFDVRHEFGRKVLFLGDLVDRGPKVPLVLRLVMDAVAAGQALCVPGNHEVKLLRALRGKDVKLTHGRKESLAQLAAEPAAFSDRVASFIDGLISHYVFDDGKLVVAHAGLPEAMHGRTSGAVRAHALYGDTTDEIDDYGLPVRFPWAEDYRGRATIVYGHTPTVEPQWLNRTLCIDTGCVFGGRLTALRYPEQEMVSVPALATYYQSAKPLLPVVASTSAQQQCDDVLDLADVIGKRVISTRLHSAVPVAAENAAAALEAMTRFAVNPKWLVYLPPTMSPCETSSLPDFLEHPTQAFAYFRKHGVGQVVCEEKHMGSRAVIVLCRSEAVALSRFGIANEGIGCCYTRTGKRFFGDPAMETACLAELRDTCDRAGLWEKLASDWVCLDAEVMPWSMKAQELLRTQYAAVGSAAEAALGEARTVLAMAAKNRVEVAPWLTEIAERQTSVGKFTEAYARYCWDVLSIADVRVAPFHVLASEGAVHADKPHPWHMEVSHQLAAASTGLVRKTSFEMVDLSDAESEARATAWWLSLVAQGGEGMVVKPLDFITRGPKGLVQPAVKVRGPEYLRIIYGPEYSLPGNLPRLRSRHLSRKRGLALSEFALGLESLERFVRREPLRRVHECVFGVLALESEPVDPRL